MDAAATSFLFTLIVFSAKFVYIKISKPECIAIGTVPFSWCLRAESASLLKLPPEHTKIAETQRCDNRHLPSDNALDTGVSQNSHLESHTVTETPSMQEIDGKTSKGYKFDVVL